jgi:hypothetical protein
MTIFISTKTKAIKLCLFESGDWYLNTWFILGPKKAAEICSEIPDPLEIVYFDDRHVLALFVLMPPFLFFVCANYLNM